VFTVFGNRIRLEMRRFAARDTFLVARFFPPDSAGTSDP
jgi:hypothetical protein